MSMIGELVTKLECWYEDHETFCDCTLIKEAIDTIKDLSKKFAAANMERSSQYYGGGWIPCSEHLPEAGKDVLVTVKYTGYMGMYGTWIKTGHLEHGKYWFGDFEVGEVIGWMPLPAPYQPTHLADTDTPATDHADQDTTSSVT